MKIYSQTSFFILLALPILLKIAKGVFQKQTDPGSLASMEDPQRENPPLFSLLIFQSMPDTYLTNWDRTKDFHSLISLTTLLPGSRWKFVCESPIKYPRVNVHSPRDLIVHKSLYSSSVSLVGKDFNTQGLR